MNSIPALDPRRFGGGHTLCIDEPDPGHRAIAHALAMRFDDVEECFRWLYDFGSEPMSPDRVGAGDATAPILSQPMRAMLGCHFRHGRAGIWDVWSRHDTSEPPVWKAYVNPRFAELRTVALRIGPRLVDTRVSASKMVTQRWMALRPDKLMVYFHDPADRAAWIEETLPVLAGIAANPVPFTRRCDAAGLITMATDPVEAPGQSWRSTLVRRIAVRLTQAGPPTMAQLCADLRQAGIDPTTWERTDECVD